MVSYFFSIIWIGMELLCCLLFTGAFLPHRKNKKTSVAFVVILLWILMCVYSNTSINKLIKQVFTIIFLTGLSVLFYHGKWLVHFSLVVVCYVFTAVIDSFIVNGARILLGISYVEFVWRKLTYISVVTIDKLLAVFISWLFFHFRTTSVLQQVKLKWLILSMLFPAVSVVMLTVLFYNSQMSEELSISTIIFSAFLTIANIAILYIVTVVEKATKQEQEMVLLKQQISLQTDNYNTLQKNYSSQRKATHEFERHIQVLQDLMIQQQFSTAQEYVRQLQNNRILHVFSIHSNHPVIDVILNQKHQVAQEYNIKMHVQMNDLSALAIQTDALVVLLSNLLDNAIEACQRMDTRGEIHCSLLLDEGLYLAIRNTSLPVEIINGEIASSKSEQTEHGYGLPAVRYILEKLCAEYTFEYTEGWFQFAAEIPP